LTQRPAQQLNRQSHWESVVQLPPVPEEVVLVELLVVELLVVVVPVVVEVPPCPPMPATWRSGRAPHAATTTAPPARIQARTVARATIRGLSLPATIETSPLPEPPPAAALVVGSPPEETMSIVLHHHPFTRAANVVWMLEEVGVPYELRFVDVMSGAHKKPEITALNPMGKLPTLVDGETVVTESAAIGLYLADRYASGRLAPALDDPARGTYLRWSLYAPSVIEPGAMAKLNGWSFKPSAAGWGTIESMMATIESVVAGRDYVLGERFSMADMIFGGTVSYMVRFKTIEPSPAVAAYIERLQARPTLQRAEARNAAIAKEHGLATG
jgi:glutathione S-transferase